MANLRDIRTRINSVITTKQVTSAMKMVSAAKLKKAQDEVSNIRPYSNNISNIISRLANSLSETENIDFSVAGATEKQNTLIIAIASNRGLCGAFNSNVTKEIQHLLSNDFKNDFKYGKVNINVIGKQLEKQLKSRDIPITTKAHHLLDDANYSNISKFSNEILNSFKTGEYTKVIIVYNEFKNAATQEVKAFQFLPFNLETSASSISQEYIIEPDAKTVIDELVPKMLKVAFYRIVLESIASEHGARMTSMHKATDNATELIRELQLSYNKARQASITNQIVEITGGAEALKG